MALPPDERGYLNDRICVSRWKGPEDAEQPIPYYRRLDREKRLSEAFWMRLIQTVEEDLGQPPTPADAMGRFSLDELILILDFQIARFNAAVPDTVASGPPPA